MLLLGLVVAAGVLMPVAASASPPWNVQALASIAPGTPTALPSLVSISCTSPSYCVAVGYDVPYLDNAIQEGVLESDEPLAEVWSDGAWSTVQLPTPSDATLVKLTAVSCVSPGVCVAVGDDGLTNGDLLPVAETLSNGIWTATALPLPSRASLSPGSFGQSTGPLLGGISCVSSTSCVAVGNYSVKVGRSGGYLCCDERFPLGETLTGSTWVASRLPTAPNGYNAILSGISCAEASTDGCVAMGLYSENGVSDELGFVDTLIGRRWRSTAAGIPGAGPFGWSVSCSVERWCMGVNDGVVELGADNSWSTTSVSVDGFGPVVLDAVSCTAERECSALGASIPASGTQDDYIGVQLSGATWTAQPISIPISMNPGLLSLSCPTQGSCVAAGSLFPATLISASLSNDVWTVATITNPPPLPFASLTSVSCPSAGDCVAVGSYLISSSFSLPLVETLSDNVWHSSLLPLPPDAIESGLTSGPSDPVPLLESVSCTSMTSCVAVGYYSSGPTGKSRPLIETLSDGSWLAKQPAELSLPYRLRGANGVLSGVSCTSSASCTAVGIIGREVLVVMLGDGDWTSIALSPPRSAVEAWLYSVSCTSSTRCVAVGQYTGRGTTGLRAAQVAPLAAEFSNSVWSFKKLGWPRGANPDVSFDWPMLQSISCPSAGSCVAVGTYAPSLLSIAPMSETLTGGKWSALSLPRLPSASWSPMWGISCSAISRCVATGSSNGVPIVENLTGGAWSLDTIPPPTSAPATLNGVSCTERSDCVAVGAVNAPNGVTSLVASSG